MAGNSHENSVGQEALIVAHPGAGMVVENFNAGPHVNLEAARLHRLNVLSLFSAVNQREIYYDYHKNRELAPGDEPKREATLESIVRKRDALEEEAKREFGRSIGLGVSGATAHEYAGFDFNEFRVDALRQWTTFQARFRSSNKSQARSQYRAELLEKWAPSDINREFSGFDRTYDLRPFISAKEATRLQTRGRDYPLLGTQARLLAIFDDPRAGFLPKTNREKNTVMTHLDYFDNPDFPLEIVDQFFEVFIHQQILDTPRATDSPEQRAIKLQRARERRFGGIHMGRRSIESITYEIGDYMHAAERSKAGLIDLRDRLREGVRPTLAITEEVSPEDLGLRALLQYIHLAQYRQIGKVPQSIKYPLRTKEDRWRHEDERSADDVGRNKIVEDLYTGPTVYLTMSAKLAQAAGSVTVKQVFNHIEPAIRDSDLRYGYHRRSLMSIVEAAPDSAAMAVRHIAEEALAEVA